MSKKQQGLLLTLIILIGVALRAIYLAELPHSPEFEHPLLDHLYHDLWARHIAFGSNDLPKGIPSPAFDQTPYFRPPGYPYFLAGVYSAFGTNPYLPRIIQMLFGIGSCLLGFFFAKKWFGQNTALLFTGFMATSWIFIFYEGKLHSPFLLVFLALLLIYCLSLLIDRMRIGTALLSGVILGLYALTRPNILTFIPFAFAWIAWIGSRKNEKKKAILAALVFVSGAVLTIMPATIRNYVRAKDPVLISANGGINLFFGNNEYSDGVSASHPEIGAWSCFDYPRIVRDLEHRQSTPMTYGKASSFYTRRAIKYIKTHPLDAMELTLKKFILFWAPMEVASYNDVASERAHSVILKNLPIQFSLALALALTGLGMCIQRIKTGPSTDETGKTTELLILIVLFILVYSGTLSLFIISGRYRVPLIPFILLGAAYATGQFIHLFMEHKNRPLIIWGAVFAGLYLLTSTNVCGYRTKPDQWHQHQAIIHEQAGNWEESVVEMKTAVQINPMNAELRSNLGAALAAQGEIHQAIVQFSKAIELDPLNLDAHVGLGKALARTGNIQGAIIHFQKALEISPASNEAHTYYGSALVLMGNRGAAMEQFEEALQLNPESEYAHLYMGDLLLRQGSTEDAIAHFRQVLEINPTSSDARVCLGNILSAQGDTERAKHYFKDALNIDPECVEAQAGLMKLLENRQPR